METRSSRRAAATAEPMNTAGDIAAKRADPAPGGDRRTARSMARASSKVPSASGTRASARTRIARQAVPVEVNKNPYTPAIKKPTTTRVQSHKLTPQALPAPEQMAARAPPAAVPLQTADSKTPLVQKCIAAVEANIELSLEAPPTSLSPIAAPQTAQGPKTADPLTDTQVKLNPLPSNPCPDYEMNQTLFAQAPVAFLPLLPRSAASGFRAVFNGALAWQHPTWHDLVISGMSCAQAYHILTALSQDSGSIDSDGTPMATLASQRFLVEDPVAQLQISAFLGVHDQRSEETRTKKFDASPDAFPLEYWVVRSHTDGWNRAMKYALMGVSMDASEVCTSISHTSEVPEEERVAMVEYVQRLVAGAKRANMPLEWGQVTTPEDASNRELCITVVRLLLFALKIVVSRQVPEWMHFLVDNQTLASVSFAIALQDRMQLGPVVDWAAVWDVMKSASAAAENDHRYKWCRVYMQLGHPLLVTSTFARNHVL